MPGLRHEDVPDRRLIAAHNHIEARRLPARLFPCSGEARMGATWRARPSAGPGDRLRRHPDPRGADHPRPCRPCNGVPCPRETRRGQTPSSPGSRMPPRRSSPTRVRPACRPRSPSGSRAPGPLDPWRGIVVAPPNLAGWRDVPLGARVAEALDLPTFVERDTNVAVLAEWRYGAARGARTAIYVTVSTGIGGGLIVDGRPVIGPGRHGRRDRPHRRRPRRPALRLRRHRPRGGDCLRHRARARRPCTDRSRRLGAPG